MGWWCSAAVTASSSSSAISCRCWAVKPHIFKLPNSSWLHTNASPSLNSDNITSAIRIRVPYYKNNGFEKRKSSAFGAIIIKCTSSGTETELENPPPSSSGVDCVGTGQDVECVITPYEEEKMKVASATAAETESLGSIAESVWEWAVLISPFFFWGTAMVAMKEILPKSGPFFLSAFRLIPAGFLLVAFAASRGRPFPSGFNAWLSISLFALVDAACFQVCAVFFIPAYFSEIYLSFRLVFCKTLVYRSMLPRPMGGLAIEKNMVLIAILIRVTGFSC